jgi:hypothetical protein
MDARAEAKRSGSEVRLRARSNEIVKSKTELSTAVYCKLVVLPKRSRPTLDLFASAIQFLCLC